MPSKYDAAGNLTKKGNKYTNNTNDTVTFTATSGDGVEYWQYKYDLLNRLIEVDKNGSVVATYGYSPDGLRQVKRAKGVTTHYIFEGTEPILEKRISDGKMITLNNRSLTALSEAGLKPTVLINKTGDTVLEKVLTERLVEMGGTPSNSIIIRTCRLQKIYPV